MRRGLIVYRCGAEAVVLYPEDAPDALERLAARARRRDCDDCRRRRPDGWELDVDDGHLDLWRVRDVTPTGGAEGVG